MYGAFPSKDFNSLFKFVIYSFKVYDPNILSDHCIVEFSVI